MFNTRRFRLPLVTLAATTGFTLAVAPLATAGPSANKETAHAAYHSKARHRAHRRHSRRFAARQATATIGTTSIGGSQSDLNANEKRVNEYSLSQPGTLTTLSVYLAPTSTKGTQSIEGVVYANSSGSPAALLGHTNVLSFANSKSAGWYTLTLSPQLKLNAGNYWIGILTGNTADVAAFAYNTATGTPRTLNGNTFSSGPSNPFGTASTDDKLMSLYATYTSSTAAPTNTAAPTISGTPQVGQTLTASPGSWSGSPTGYDYAWQRCASSCTPISGATASSYTLAAADQNDTIDVVVTATNVGGSAAAASPQTAAVTAPSGATGATVSATPDGVPAPSGGWKVEYADGFGAPLGTGAGQDDTLIPTSYPTYGCTNNAPPFNSNELEVFNCSADSVGSNGLALTCRYTPGAGSYYGTTQNYTCGAATSRATAPSGYKFFKWNVTSGAEWAFQAVVEWPPNTGEADPGFWSPNDGSTEIDFFEGFGHEAGTGGSWCTPGSGSNGYVGATMPAVVGSTYAEDNICPNLGFDPSTGFHTYTSVLYPGNMLSEYVDGHLVDWTYVPDGGSGHTSTLLGPATITSGYRGLELSYPMRDQADCPSSPANCDPDPYFASGTRTMTFRSVAVYESASANDAGTQNAEIAPGTTVSGG